jgi:uncharacterized membrane protein YcaP (DUF421 family)
MFIKFINILLYEEKFMLLILIRSIILYLLVLIVMRLMGKREIRSASAI